MSNYCVFWSVLFSEPKIQFYEKTIFSGGPWSDRAGR